ncbi:LAFA_0F05798g1_1 [Lachancea sp. 'fantastica']|nr:LAFA_0F05798g1_1 [Lachancea sp. 'fantastica']
MAFQDLYNANGWLVTAREGVLEVYFEQNLVNRAVVEGFNEFQCFKLAGDGDEVLSIFGKKAGTVVRMWFNSDSDDLQEECVLNVNFAISSFRVLPAVGWILATDSVAGVLHVFDTLNSRYKGQIRLDMDHCEICIRGAREFMVLARKFDQDSLIIKTFLNTYVIDPENQVILVASVSADHHYLPNRWICSGGCSNKQWPFALVSSCNLTGGSLMEFFVSKAQTPFQTLTLAEPVLAHQMWFSTPFTVVLVLQTPEKLFRICEFDIATNRETRSAMLLLDETRTTYPAKFQAGFQSRGPENSVADVVVLDVVPLSVYRKPSSFSSSLLRFLGNFFSSVLVFTPEALPNVILTWQNETLKTWHCPSAVLNVRAALDHSTLLIQCRARETSKKTEFFQIEIS